MGVSWTLAYLLIIKRGFQDQTFGMPVVALCANLSWEFIFSFIYPSQKTQRIINLVWFLCDVVIVFQFLKYGPQKPGYAYLPTSIFYLTFVGSLAVVFMIILLITQEFNDWQGKYTACGQNLMMSILFVTTLISRGDVAGQSLYIALFKLIGTLVPSLAIYLYYSPRSKLLGFLGLVTFVFDLIYLVLVYQASIELGLIPWLRF